MNYKFNLFEGKFYDLLFVSIKKIIILKQNTQTEILTIVNDHTLINDR